MTFQFHQHKQDHNEHNVFIDYICGATWKFVITNGLVFFTSQITFKRLIIDEYVACVIWCCATLVDVIAQIFSQRMDNNIFHLYIALVTSNWLLTVWDRNKGVIRCSIIDAIIKSEAWWQNNILQGHKTFLGWSYQVVLWCLTFGFILMDL